MMCLSDGYSKQPTCASFKLTIDDPMKSKSVKASSSANKDNKDLKQYKGTFAITKIQKDGILSLSVFCQRGSQEIANAIDNTTIEF